MPWHDRFFSWKPFVKHRFEIYAFVLLAAIIVCFFVQMFYSASDTARKVSCASKVRFLARALMMYADDYNGEYPPEDKWAIRLLPYVDSIDSYFCPADKGHMRFREQKGHIDLPISYWYRKPKPGEENSFNTPICGDRMYTNFAGNHTTGGNVGYIGGDVRWRTIEQWEEMKLPTDPLRRKGAEFKTETVPVENDPEKPYIH